MTSEVQEKQKVFIFCPEEPELTIFASGARPYRFTNGRLVLDEDDPAVGHFTSQRPRFLVARSLDEPRLGEILLQRLSAVMARRADAQNPVVVNNDASMMLAFMLDRAAEAPRRGMTSAEAIEELVNAMPRTMQDTILRVPFEDSRHRTQDDLLIREAAERALRGDTDLDELQAGELEEPEPELGPDLQPARSNPFAGV